MQKGTDEQKHLRWVEINGSTINNQFTVTIQNMTRQEPDSDHVYILSFHN